MELKTRVEELSGVRRRVNVEMSAADADREYHIVAGRFHRRAKLPGFRPGKAPLDLVKRYYAEDIRQELISRLVPETFREAVQQLNLSPLADPSWTKLAYQAGQPLSYSAEFEVLPRFEMGKYKGLELTAAEITVTDSDLEQQLEELRRRHATLEPVEDRPIQAGDFAVIDLVGVQIGAHGEDLKQIIEQENLQVAVGDERTHPAFSEALIDLNIAEGKQVEISYQRDYPDQILAGKRVRFSFEVTDIKTRAIPQLSDEFARDVGDYGGLDDLKQEIRRQLGEQVLRRKDEGARRQALQKLIELTPIEAPDVLVAQEIDRRIQDYAVHLQSQGIDPLRSSVNWSELRQSLHAGAVKDVQGKLLLSKIAEVEGLAVSDEELEEEKARMATVMNLPPEKIAQRFSDSARQQSLREHLMRQKSLRLVLDSARIDFVEPADSTVE